MNKLFSKVATLSVGLAMAIGVGVAVGSKQVKAVKADGTANFTLSSADSVTVDGVTASFAKGSGSSAPTWYAAGLRLYASNTVTISSDATITGISFSWEKQGSKAFATATASAGTYSHPTNTGTGTWTGNETSVVFTLGSSGQLQLNTFSVTYSGGSSDTFKVSYNGNATTIRPVGELPSNHTGLNDGDTQQLSDSATRWGYSFLGWGLSADATSYVTSVTIDGADVTVYAIWEEDHTVAGAWEDSPYTVAQARTAIDKNENLTSVYVAGIISQVDSYNSNYKSIQYWISDDGTTTNQFEVYSGKGLNGADFSSVNDVEVGAEVVINGNIKKYSSTYEFDKSSKQIVYNAPSTGDIEVTFQPSNFLGVGDSGTYTASTEAANPSYSFSSDNSSVLSVSSNGAFSAVAAGSATVRVDVTSDDGNGYKEVAVTVVAVKSVSEAYEIAEGLASGATTDYSIKVTGYLSELDADGKARAVNLTDGEKVIEVFFGAGNADYTTVTSSGVIGSKVTLFAKVQNYSGTYELKDIILSVIADGDANSYAAGAFAYLDGSCETGPAAVTEDQWTTVKNGFDALDSEEQAEFKKEELSGNVEKWVGRYTRIVSNTELENFMSLASIVRRNQYSFELENNPTIIIVIAIAAASTLAFTLLLVFKKRKHN